MRIVSVIVLVIIGLVFCALIYYLVVGAIIFRHFLAKKTLKSRLNKKSVDKELKKHKIDLCWWKDNHFERVKVQSEDQLELVGYFKNSDSNKTAIVVHGFGGSHLEMQPICKFFTQKNFNVLAIDCRAHGESEGKCVGFGWLDRKDILLWIDFLQKRQPDSKIILYGVSMGGATVCCSAGEKLPQNVIAIISDCAFANLDRQINHVMRNNKLILKLFKWHLYDYVNRMYGFDMTCVDVVGQVKRTKIPILYLHGKEDKFVQLKNVFDLYDATPEHLRQMHIFDDAEHAMSYATMGVVYEKKISDFLKSRTVL